MNATRAKTKNKSRIVIYSLLVLGLVAIGYQSRVRTQQSRNCRICAATYDHWNLLVLGIPIWNWDTEVKPTKDTKNYFDSYLGYPHEHEWTGGGYSRYSSTLVSCGKSQFGPYPQHQRKLTSMGLRLVAASGIEDSQQRQAFFERIVFPEDINHYSRVLETYDMISDQIPKEPWAKWYPYSVWSPTMEGIEIPKFVREGNILPATTP